jgi:hypothetical protein
MRQKASQEFLHVGAAFSNVVTVRTDEWPRSHPKNLVECRGPRSIFAALASSIPDIARTQVSVTLKGALSEVELNKFLARSGYVLCRQRDRVKGERGKWIRHWKHRRWVDPTNGKELSMLRAQLAEMQNRLPGPYSIFENKLVDFLLSVVSEAHSRRSCSEADDDVEDSDDDSDCPASSASKALSETQVTVAAIAASTTTVLAPLRQTAGVPRSRLTTLHRQAEIREGHRDEARQMFRAQAHLCSSTSFRI